MSDTNQTSKQVTIDGVIYDVEGILSGLVYVRDGAERRYHRDLDYAATLIRALVKERSAAETTDELMRLRELQEKALALDDAVAEFGIDKPQYIAQVYQAFHDVLHDGHGAMHAVEPTAKPPLSAQQLAVQFHETYERLAPKFGYETRRETQHFNAESPNGQLMIAVCSELLARQSVLIETIAPRMLRLDRAEAEFLVDAAEQTRIPQWMELAAEVRRLFGMGAFPAGAVPPAERRCNCIPMAARPHKYCYDCGGRIEKPWTPVAGDFCPVCSTGQIGQSGVFLSCPNCGWLRDLRT